MSSNNPSKSGKTRTLQDHSFYFGNYLNMARHNAFMILKHLSEKYEADDELDEEKLYNAKIFDLLKTANKKPDVVLALMRDLKWHFPFLRYRDILNGKLKQKSEIDGKEFNPAMLEPEEIRIFFKETVFELLNRLRNFFSHHKSKAKFGTKAPFPIKEIYESALFRLIDRGRTSKRFDYFEEKHISHLEINEQNQSAKKVPVAIEEAYIDEKSLAFFICLFLERKYAFPFISRLEHFQQKDGAFEDKFMFKASLECFTMFCCRLPQPKLESSDIMLDMLNELNRCPKELYEILSEEDQKRFLVQPDEEDDQSEDISDSEENSVGPDLVLKRHEDRFPYFALRYFDDTNAFETMRFQLHLGKVIKREYLKTINDVPRDRKLLKPIHAFGKFAHFRQLYEAVNQDDTETKTKIVSPEFAGRFHNSWIEARETKTVLKESIEQFSPHYNFGDQTIAIKFLSNIHLDGKLPNLNHHKNEIPDAILSVYEIRNLFFYHYLYKQGLIERNAETFIRDHVDNLKKFLLDVHTGQFKPVAAPPDYKKNQPLPFVKGNPDETKKKRKEYRETEAKIEERKQLLDEQLKSSYRLSLKQIPKEIKEFLLAYRVPDYAFQVKGKLEAQKKDIENRQAAIEKKRTPKIGQQASWLAEDIIFLTPPRIQTDAEGKQHLLKLNSLQAHVLQSSLAYFSINKEDIRNFFEELNLTKGAPETRHPFLSKIDLNACKGILDFYTGYLNQKAKFIDYALGFVRDKKTRKFRKANEIKEKFGYFLPINEKPAIAKSYKDIPALLPKGFFNTAIASALAKDPEYNVKESDNVVFCLGQYLKEDSQDFYNYSHLAKLPREEEQERALWTSKPEYVRKLDEKISNFWDQKKSKGQLNDDEKQKLKFDLRDATRARARILDREQTIRYHQANDRALWLMILDRQKNADEHIEIDFAKLSMNGIEKLLSDTVNMQCAVPKTNTSIIDTLPIKRYGDLRRILKDRRLENLVRYYTQPVLDHETIKLELEQYDRRRESFFALIYDFESQVFERFESNFDPAVFEEKGFYDHNTYLNIAAGKLRNVHLADHYKNNVIKFRNKFIHNEFPFFGWLEEEVKGKENPLMSDRVFDLAEAYYKDLLKRIL